MAVMVDQWQNIYNDNSGESVRFKAWVDTN